MFKQKIKQENRETVNKKDKEIKEEKKIGDGNCWGQKRKADPSIHHNHSINFWIEWDIYLFIKILSSLYKVYFYQFHHH